MRSTSDPQPPEKDVQYLVETVEGARYGSSGWEYLIKWNKYSKAENSWEAASDCQNCSESIQEFWKVAEKNAVGAYDIGAEYTGRYWKYRMSRRKALVRYDRGPVEVEGQGVTPLFAPESLWLPPEKLGITSDSQEILLRILCASLDAMSGHDDIAFGKEVLQRARDGITMSGKAQAGACGLCTLDDEELDLVIPCGCRGVSYMTSCVTRWRESDANREAPAGNIACPLCRRFALPIHKMWLMSNKARRRKSHFTGKRI
ncbi:hypothetical protein NMY22_g498 [Coprinellus aureogranulatus]|nr:hypothetical protein NMY22_g498 [Coprinellus aureogranulatus]